MTAQVISLFRGSTDVFLCFAFCLMSSLYIWVVQTGEAKCSAWARLVPRAQHLHLPGRP